MKNCKICKKKLAGHNRSGYCTKCYIKSPQWREYQRKKQNEFYYKHKDRKKKHMKRPEVQKRYKKYQKKYYREHKEELREYKKLWARKNRKLNKNKQRTNTK